MKSGMHIGLSRFCHNSVLAPGVVRFSLFRALSFIGRPAGRACSLRFRRDSNSATTLLSPAGRPVRV